MSILERLTRMTKRERLLFVVMIVVLTALAGLKYVIGPQLSRQADVVRELVAQRSLLEAQNEELRKLPNSEAELEEIHARIDAVSQKFFRYKEESDFFGSINRLAVSAGATLRDTVHRAPTTVWEPAAEAHGERRLEERVVQVRVGGSYDSLIELLKGCVERRQLIALDDIAIRLTSEASTTLEASFTMTAFVLGEAKE